MPIVDNILQLVSQGSGTVNAIMVTFNPVIIANTPAKIWVRSIGLNDDVSVTLQPNTWVAKQVKARGGQNLRLFDTGPSGYVMSLQFNVTGNYFELLNPYTSVLQESLDYTDNQISLLTDFLTGNFVSLSGSYTNPSWLVSIPSSKISDWLTSFKPTFNPSRQSSVASVTGNTNENFVILDSTQDLVGKIESGDVLSIMFGAQATNSGNNKTFRLYISDSSSSLVNPVLIGTALGTNNLVNTVEVVKYMNMTSINTQNVISGTAAGAPQTGVSMGTTSIDFSTGTKYLVCTIQLAVGTDTAKLQWLRTQINR